VSKSIAFFNEVNQQDFAVFTVFQLSASLKLLEFLNLNLNNIWLVICLNNVRPPPILASRPVTLS
jgi:hypothetical protein